MTWDFPLSVVMAHRVWREGDCGGRDVTMLCWVTVGAALATVLTVAELTGDWRETAVLWDAHKLDTGDT